MFHPRLSKIVLLSFFLCSLVASPIAAQTLVYFNLSNHKVHQLNCVWGKRCTKNCLIIPRPQAYQRGGIPCKVCGG